MKQLLLVVAALLSVTTGVCSGDSGRPEPTDVAGADVGTELPVKPDVSSADTSGPGPDTIMPLPDVQEDTVAVPDDGQFADAAADGLPDAMCHGERGCPCDDNTGCLSGYCVQTMDGKVCSSVCSGGDACPRGWFCAEIGGLGGDTTYVCQAPAQLCRPCQMDTDCAGRTPGDHHCIAVDQNGSFCGVACSSTQPCIEGFECVAVSTLEGSADQCRPASGAACPCTDYFVQQAFVTDCRSGDDPEVCNGSRTCDQACQLMVAEETCDGHDNDCDGVVDQGCNEDGDGFCGALRSVVGPPWPAICPSGPGDCNDANVAIFPGALDDPDDLFADTNCDGIDGDAARAWFVAESGADANDGTRDRPKRTIQAAIVAATGDRTQVYVSVTANPYNETITLRDGIGVFGGYDAGNGWVRSAGNVVAIQGGTVGIFANGITHKTIVERLSVRSANATSTSGSSYALVSRNSSALLEFRHMTLQAGNGAVGGNGTAGGPGANGVGGGDGQPGCEDSGIGCADCTRPQWGNGGSTQCIVGGLMKTSTGGHGGQPVKDSGWGQSGEQGRTSGVYDGGAGGVGGYAEDGCPSSLEEVQCTATTAHSCQGQTGGAGASGIGGVSAPGGLSFGSMVEATFYVAAAGGLASGGAMGKAGGGGGGGSGGDDGCNSYGSAGGGGGSGACGGAPGTSATGGGGSFGVFLFNASPTFVNCSITTGVGGRGGNGGPGGAGGTGGAGGKTYYGFAAREERASSEQEDGGCGGYGGKGGNGGTGGHGGGGGGGPSVGLVKGGTTSNPSLSGVQFVLGTAGAGGTKGGTGGNDGAAGYTAQFYPPPTPP